MQTSIPQLNEWLSKQEGLNIEFKLARNNFSNTELCKYCCALSNEGGGKLIFGVEPKKHTVVGTSIWQSTSNTVPNSILVELDIRIDIEELVHPNGRVLIVHVPPHPIGRPIAYKGVYYMRAGEAVVSMDTQTLTQKLTQSEPDFSAVIVPSISLSDLDSEALLSMRRILISRNNTTLAHLSDKDLLFALELMNESGMTYSGLILLGQKAKIDSLLPCAEIVFEWRQNIKISHDFRQEWREPFIKVYDDIWQTISNRNTRIPIQEGLLQNEILAFNEQAVREALLNAVTHRDYTITSQSTFIRANADHIVVTSPGGFLPGITPENVLNKQAPRNRRLAEVFQKLGLVERSGQGMDQIYETTIREGKGIPDLSRSDSHEVVLSIPSQVKDKDFILFLQRVSAQRQIVFSFEELYELEQLRQNKTLSKLKNKDKFLDLGIIEKIGKASGSKYILSHTYYAYQNKPGVYTRIKGLAREQKKELILQHFQKNTHARISDFVDVFPELKRKDISNILQELKHDEVIEFRGQKKEGYWQLFESVNKSEKSKTS